MHDPDRIGVEAITPMHGAAIVPHHDVALLPRLDEDVALAGGVRPKLLEQAEALVLRHADDPGALDRAPEIKRLASGLAMGADQRMHHPIPFPKILAGRLLLVEAKLAGLVIDVLEEDLPARDGLLQRLWQALIGEIGGEEVSVST